MSEYEALANEFIDFDNIFFEGQIFFDTYDINIGNFTFTHQ